MKKFLSIIVTLVILSLVFPVGVFGAAQVANLSLSLNLTDVRGQLTSPVPDRASDAYVVNPDNVMVKYRGNGEQLVTDSDDLTQGSWTTTDATVNSATLLTFTAVDGRIRSSITTVENKTYIYSFKARWISGNTGLKIVHTSSATGINSPLTITATLTRYSVAVLGKAGGGTVIFGIQDQNAAGHGQIEFTEIQVEETSVPINELEDESDYADHRISLADGQSWFGGNDLASNLFDQDGGSGGTGDKGGFDLTDLRLAEVATGSLTIDVIYEISARTDQDFTADGAPDNNPGTTFIANDTNVALDVNNKVYPIDVKWNNFQGNLVSIDSDTLKITYVDNVAGAQMYLADSWNLSSNLVVGQLYKFQFDAKVGAGDSVDVRYNPGEAGLNIDVTVTNTEFQTFSIYFVATHVFSDQIQMNNMGAGEILWLDNITIQAVTSPADFADSGYLLQVTDGSGKKASGYIGEAGTGETLGEQLLSNPSFDVNTTGWTPISTGTIDSVAGGVSNNAVRITEDNTGANPYITNEGSLTSTNKEFKFGVWVKEGTESTYSAIFNPTGFSQTGFSNLESTAIWERKEWYGVAKDNNDRIRLYQRVAQASGTTIFFDEPSFKEVTEPNLNSVMIYKTQALASEGWGNIEDGFDANGITTWEIYDNKLGDTEPRVYTPTSGATASIPAEAPFDSKGLVNIGPVTNWLLQSNGFDQAVWPTLDSPIMTQDETDIAGNVNTAWTIEDDNAGVQEYFLQNIIKSISNTNDYTFSIFIKKDAIINRFPEFKLVFDSIAYKSYNIQMNTSTGATVISADTAGNTSHEIISYGNWWKVVLHAFDNGNNNRIRVIVVPAQGLTLGGVDVDAVGSIIVSHAMLTKTPYALPFHIPTLSVPVTTTSQVVPWTMSTVFKGILSDAVNGSESEGTLIASWTPYYDMGDGSGAAGIISVRENDGSILRIIHTDTIKTYAGTDNTEVSLIGVKNTTYFLIVRWSKRQNKLQVSIIDAGVLTNGTPTSYDGTFTLETDLIIGYANNYPFSLEEVHFYDQWIVDSLLFKYPGFISGAAAGLWW